MSRISSTIQSVADAVGLKRFSELTAEVHAQELRRQELEQQINGLLAQQRALRAEMLATLDEIKSFQQGRAEALGAQTIGESQTGYGSLTATILDVLASRPDHAWTNAEIISAVGSGSRTTVNATLYRLQRDGRIQKIGQGRYAASEEK